VVAKLALQLLDPVSEVGALPPDVLEGLGDVLELPLDTAPADAERSSRKAQMAYLDRTQGHADAVRAVRAVSCRVAIRGLGEREWRQPSIQATVSTIRNRDSLTTRELTWASTVGLVLVLCFLTGFALLTQRSASTDSRAADRATRLASIYANTRYLVGQEESLERKYRLEPEPSVLARHARAASMVTRDLARVHTLDGSAATSGFLARVGRDHATYLRASRRIFRAVDAHDSALVLQIDGSVTDPAFGALQQAVDTRSETASATALRLSASLRAHLATAMQGIIIAFALGLLMIAALGCILLRLRRRLGEVWEQEIAVLAELAMSDPLTGLRNHRAFHEDLARAVHKLGRSAAPLSLIMIDLDGLKGINDGLGHQAGDEHLMTLADAMRATARASDGIYRIGGDEFAIVLEGQPAKAARELMDRLNARLAASGRPLRVTVSSGIVDTRERRHKDALIREADLALLAAKRSSLAVVVYSSELSDDEGAERGSARAHTGTLANALALAVNAKDAYTRGHCQTVSQLCAGVASELDLCPERIARIRLAGLLHDVGKIGVPDDILNKPARLTVEEFAQMQRHSTLGGEIVAAAELAEESYWVRHHHERYDGTGYPDHLAGGEIPLESRIILACDAYEAMASDRPYRTALGHAFAIEELRRHAGTQFDPEVVEALCRVLDSRDGDSLPGPRGLLKAA
jgi:diguanylate cyclase (GGDEF)-like protein